jgi:hypothetical protein
MSKQIFSKIAKIGEEVRSAEPMKVELAKIDDLISLVNKSRQDSSAMVDSYVKARAASKTGVAAAEKHLQNLKEVSALMQKIKSDSQELGIDVSQIKEYRLADDFLNGNPENATKIMIQRMKELL